MEILLAILALTLIAVPGILLGQLIAPRANGGSWAVSLGYGLLLGLISVPLAIRLLDSLSLPLSPLVLGVAVGGMSIALYVLALRRGCFRAEAGLPLSLSVGPSVLQRLLLGFLLSMLIVRAGVFVMEVTWRPLFPWDATMHWATKARVWFEHSELLPFVNNTEWLKSPDPEVFTDYHPRYPITTPLLQFWMASFLGSWNESLMNLPWVLCFIGLGLAFFGQAREAGANTVVAAAFTYFLLSMPLLNTHIGLAGYADVFLGTTYCLALMALHNWSRSRQRFQAVFAAVFALSCLLIKNEGLFWLLTFLPALLIVWFPGRRSLLMLSVLLVAAVGILVVFPRDVEIAGHSLAQLNLGYRPGVLGAVFDSFYLHANWHLFAYLLVMLLGIAVFSKRIVLGSYKRIGVALFSAVFLFLFLFVFTGYSGGALRFTAVGRISLQLVPACMFLCLLLTKDLLAGEAEKNTEAA